MGQSNAIKFGEKELSALNDRAEALAKEDAGDWEEAVDWGVPFYGTMRGSEWRVAKAPDFE